MEHELATLTPKGIQTRHHLFETAIGLFIEKGYEETTMRQIAKKADCSIGLAYRYFDRKEAFVVALYEEMSDEWRKILQGFEPDSLSNLFTRAMEFRFGQLTPYRDLLGVLLGTMMNPNSEVAVLGDAQVAYQEVSLQEFQDLVELATDTPKKPDPRTLALMFYVIHMLLQLFWLYDKSPNQQATHKLLAMTQDGIRKIRPVLGIPFVSKSIIGVMETIGEVFGRNWLKE